VPTIGVAVAAPHLVPAALTAEVELGGGDGAAPR
jgi:hypothetical protein